MSSVAVTDRSAGVSTGRYAGLNLGAHVADDPSAVAENRRLLERTRPPVVYMEQCHGAEVAVVDGVPEEPAPVRRRRHPLHRRRPRGARRRLRAGAPRRPGGVVAAVHAGRPGMVAGVVPRALDAMRDLGAGRSTPSSARRCADGATRCPRDARDAAAVPPVSATVSWTGTPAVDIAAGVVAQLPRGRGGVSLGRRAARARTTTSTPTAATGVTGRFAGVVRVGGS